MNCSLCNSETNYIFNIGVYKIYECRKCAHRNTPAEDLEHHVIKTYDDNYFFGSGAGYPNYLDEKDILIEHGHRYGRLLSKYIQRPGAVLDIGAAAGFILKGLENYGWDGFGIEANDKMATYGREKLDLKIETVTVERFRTNTKFDLICFIQIIAHLIDPLSAIKIATEYLSDKGYILIETWDYRSLTAKLFGKKWHEYCPPSVLHWFSLNDLNLLMEKFGLKLFMKGRPIKRLSFKHAKSIIRLKFGHNLAYRWLNIILMSISDTWTVRYPGNDIFWVLYRKSS